MLPSYCLSLDLGNSALKWAVYRLPQRDTHLSTGLSPVLSLEEQGWFEYPMQAPETFKRQLATSLTNIRSDTRPLPIIGCSVVPSLNPLVEAICSEVFNLQTVNPVRWITPHSLEGLSLGNYPSDRLGADRWANLLAAHYEHPEQALLIADFGTATTLNVLLPTAKGHQFAGGQILPGYQTFGSILAQKTAQLPPTLHFGQAPIALLGQDTQSSIQAGLFYGYPAMIIALIEAIQTVTMANQPLWLLATGGLSASLKQPLQTHFGKRLIFDSNLTLRGVTYSLLTSFS